MNVYFLLDRSSSMQNLWIEAIGSINGFVDGLPNNTKIQLALFDSISYDVVRETTAKEWKNIKPDEFAPRGGTPLFDSAARMMQRAFDDNPEKAIFVVMTDGEENSSKNFKQADVKAMVKKFEAKFWEVNFIGANFDKVGDTAFTVGVGAGKFADVKPQNFEKSLRSYAAASTAYATADIGDGAINMNDVITKAGV